MQVRVRLEANLIPEFLDSIPAFLPPRAEKMEFILRTYSYSGLIPNERALNILNRLKSIEKERGVSQLYNMHMFQFKYVIRELLFNGLYFALAYVIFSKQILLLTV